MLRTFVYSLEAVHPDAYQAFQTTRDINSVILKCVPTVGEVTQSALKIDVKTLTPVLPMLVSKECILCIFSCNCNGSPCKFYLTKTLYINFLTGII